MFATRKAGLIFTAHLANWNCRPRAPFACFSASISTGPPNIARRRFHRGGAHAAWQHDEARLDAPFKRGRALERGEHVAMLVDQPTTQGVDVVFFGRWVKASPLLAQLARLSGAPIRGIRASRLPDGNHFRGELTEEVAPVRDANGEIDIQGTTQAITAVVEGWIREAIQSNGSGCIEGGANGHLPVLILVHSRFIARCVFWSCAAMV